MGEYLLTGHNSAGRKVTEHIVASSADEAVEVLQSRGFQDIVLHTDDAGAHYLRYSERKADMSPREALSFHLSPGWSAAFFFIVRKGYADCWGILPFRARSSDLPDLVHERRSRRGLEHLGLPVADRASSAIEFALVYQLFYPQAGQYRKIQEAAAWGRWQEVLDRLPRIRLKLAPDALAFEKAKALAGLRRLDEAFEVLKPFSDGVKMPEWLYWNRLGEVYAAAQQREMAVTMMEHAAELEPENPTVLIGLASSLVRERHDRRTARRLLDAASSHALTEILISRRGVCRRDDSPRGRKPL